MRRCCMGRPGARTRACREQDSRSTDAALRTPSPKPAANIRWGLRSGCIWAGRRARPPQQQQQTTAAAWRLRRKRAPQRPQENPHGDRQRDTLTRDGGYMLHNTVETGNSNAQRRPVAAQRNSVVDVHVNPLPALEKPKRVDAAQPVFAAHEHALKQFALGGHSCHGVHKPSVGQRALHELQPSSPRPLAGRCCWMSCTTVAGVVRRRQEHRLQHVLHAKIADAPPLHGVGGEEPERWPRPIAVERTVAPEHRVHVLFSRTHRGDEPLLRRHGLLIAAVGVIHASNTARSQHHHPEHSLESCLSCAVNSARARRSTEAVGQRLRAERQVLQYCNILHRELESVAIFARQTIFPVQRVSAAECNRGLRQKAVVQLKALSTAQH